MGRGVKKKVIYPEQEEIIFVTKEAILERGKSAVGKTVGEIDKYGRLSKDGVRGRIGHIIEESLYGYHPNSDSKPDFEKAGVELKSTGALKDKKKGYTAKERLVLNIINYMKEVDKTFETSSFWTKNRLLMFIIYEYLENREQRDFPIIGAELFTYPEKDLIIIRDDWKKIVQKIRDGKAHELSEGDTLYLGACTKGLNAEKSLRQQPRSNEEAKQRAYCLKKQYMRFVIEDYIFGKRQEETIIKDIQSVAQQGFESFVLKKLDEYHGRSVKELKEEFGITNNPKNLSSLLAFRILGLKGNKAEELEKAGVVIKTVRVNYDGTITQHMSFPTFKYRDLAKEDAWEDSWFGNYMRDTRFLLIIFRYDKVGEQRLAGGQFWNIPYNDLEVHVRTVWQRARDIIKEGRLVVDIKNEKLWSNLPKPSENHVSHVRPHGRNRNKSINPLPEGTKLTINSTDGSLVWPYDDKYPTHCFWLNNTYVLSHLEERFKK